MTENIIASVPLGWVVGVGLFIALTAFLVGQWVTGRQYHKKLQEIRSEASCSLEALIDVLPHAAFLADKGGGIRFCNDRTRQILKTEFDEPTVIPIQISRAIGRSLASGIGETVELSLPASQKRRLQVFITPLNVAGDREDAFVQMIDPRKDAERLDFSQHMTRTLAHELRTPLTAILGHVEVLNSCKIDEEALWHRSLGFVNSETERLARLVEDILTLSRLERVPLHLQPVNLRLAAEEAISALYDEAEKSGASLVLQSSANLPRVAADSDRIRQVFINLLDNAIKYAPGDVITVRLTAEPTLVKVIIHDTGPGIAQDDQAHVFEPFYRGGLIQRSQRGTGLGLTIVRAIIEQHSSSISVFSHPGEGTTFSFSLPLVQAEN